MRIDSSDAIATGWVGARDAAHVPARKASARSARTQSGAVFAAALVAEKRVWWRSALKFVRDAAIGVALLACVPLAFIGLRGGAVTPSLSAINDMRARVDDAARLRALMAPIDGSVTPMDAGIALHRIAAHRRMANNDMFPTREVPARVQRPWENRPKAIGMFPPTSSNGIDAQVASHVIALATGALGSAEMTSLERVAQAPVWGDFDVVASAAAVDVIGGAFTLPFRADAFAYSMPVPRFADTKALAYAGVSRAAYYLATGQPARAEAALKSIVSFGFAFIDNGTTAFDAMLGRVIVDIGRNGLHQLYKTTGNARGLALAEPLPKSSVPQEGARRLQRFRRGPDAALARRQLIAALQDPGMPRALRYQALGTLATSSCGNVREVLFGADEDVRSAFAGAGTTVARFPSEQAFLELLSQVPSRVPLSEVRSSWANFLLHGAAVTASTVLHNPRIASCALLVRMQE